MRDFQAMFPGLTPMVIEAVLRANGGAVDPTVEKLIAMCCEQQQQKEKEKEFLHDTDLLPGYYEACCKEQPPPSYHSSQIYTDASTQTEQSLESGRNDDSTTSLVNDRTSLDNVERLCVAPLSSASNSTSSVSSNGSSSVKEDDDEKVALYLQNRELLQQLRQKQRIIEYLERNSKCCDGCVLNSWFTMVMCPLSQVVKNKAMEQNLTDTVIVSCIFFMLVAKIVLGCHLAFWGATLEVVNNVFDVLT